MKTANFNQKNTKYTPTRYFLSRHLGHLKPPRTFLTRHLFIDGHLLPSDKAVRLIQANKPESLIHKRSLKIDTFCEVYIMNR